jgi:hypothetical protein
VLANSPFAYKTFHDNYSNSPTPSRAEAAVQPKAVPLMQFTHLRTVADRTSGNFGTLVRPNCTTDRRRPVRCRAQPSLSKQGHRQHGMADPASHGNRQQTASSRNAGQDQHTSMRRGNRHMFNSGPRRFRRRHGRRRFSQRFASAIAHVVRPRSFGGGRRSAAAASGGTEPRLQQ